VQCLHDYSIPLTLSTTVAKVHGRDRVEAVEVAPVDKDFKPLPGKSRRIECDTLLLSVGLIPENELSRALGVAFDPVTRGPLVDSTMMTSKPGIFACGNVLHVHDLADYVTEESLVAGRYAGLYATGTIPARDELHLVRGPKVRYALPHTLARDREHRVYLRVLHPMENCRLLVGGGKVYSRKLRIAHPAEMIQVKLTPDMLAQATGPELTIDVVQEGQA